MPQIGLSMFSYLPFHIHASSLRQHTIPTLHPEDHRKADKQKKKKKKRKEREHSAGEESGFHPVHSTQLQYPVSFGDRPIKQEPEDDVSIPLHPQHLPNPAPCKEEPKEEHHQWEGQELEEGVVRVQKVEGLQGNRTVFRQGKQVVFRDEDGSGEDEDIMVDSGKVISSLLHVVLRYGFHQVTKLNTICVFSFR